MAKKSASRAAAPKGKNPAAKPGRPAAAGKRARVRWFDDKSGAPLIEKYSREMGGFLKALEDGRVDAAEIKGQEARLVQAMKAVESLLTDEQHGKVTALLCELTAYDLMQVLHAMDQARRKRPAFRG